MNILEHYIKEIVSVDPYEADWTVKTGKEFVKVVVIANCYGQVKPYTQIYDNVEWEKIKEQGYFWG